MVHRGSSGMAVYSCDECQYGCALPIPHPFRDAGTGVFCTKYPPVFTIPVGYLLGGLLVDKVFEPLMEGLCQGHILHLLFGSGKGSGAAVLFLLLGILGTGTCLIFRRDRHLWMLEQKVEQECRRLHGCMGRGTLFVDGSTTKSQNPFFTDSIFAQAYIFFPHLCLCFKLPLPLGDTFNHRKPCPLFYHIPIIPLP